MRTSQRLSRLANQRGSTAAGALALIGGLLAVGCVLLPWLSVSVPIAGERSFDGWVWIEGKIVVLLGALVVLMGVLLILKKSGGTKPLAIGAIVLSVGILAIGVYDLINIADRGAAHLGSEMIDELEQSELVPPEQLAAASQQVTDALATLDFKAGAGLYLALLGGVLGLVGGIVGLMRGSANRATTEAASTSTPATATTGPVGAPAAPAAPETPPAPPASQPGPTQP